jgi:hypothetical protein
MNKKVAFFTVCGGGEDYDFLLGSIDHHARMGSHLVLDTAIHPRSKSFKNLPRSVKWIHAPNYGEGWDKFRFVDALRDAQALTMDIFNPAVLVQLDSDDFYAVEAEPLFVLGASVVVEMQYVHWMKDGEPYIFGESEWHRRIWPAGRGITVERDPGWAQSRVYDGNPDTHPRVMVPDWVPVMRFDGLFRHHVHFALGSKANDHRIAKTSISGWPHAGRLVDRRPWPDKLWLWKERGILPSSFFV